MNKTMEYMSYALPVVAFDLHEPRVSGGDAVCYVEPNDVELYAKAIGELLDNPERRMDMGVEARHRAESLLDWAPQRRNYVGGPRARRWTSGATAWWTSRTRRYSATSCSAGNPGPGRGVNRPGAVSGTRTAQLPQPDP